MKFSKKTANGASCTKAKKKVARDFVGMKNFRHVANIGEGGQSSVHKVEWKNPLPTGKMLCMKLIQKEQGMDYKLSLERSLGAKSNSPFISEMLFAFKTSCYYHLVSDIQKCNLLLVKEATPEQIWRLAGEMIAGLSFLHKNGFLHTDIKPENFLLTEDNHVKLCDFGSCLKIENEMSFGKSSYMRGSQGYNAPETFREIPVIYTQACDSWALGASLFLLCTARRFIAYDKFSLPEEIKLRTQCRSYTSFRVTFIKDKLLRRFIREFLTHDPQKRALVLSPPPFPDGYNLIKGLTQDEFNSLYPLQFYDARPQRKVDFPATADVDQDLYDGLYYDFRFHGSTFHPRVQEGRYKGRFVSLKKFPTHHSLKQFQLNPEIGTYSRYLYNSQVKDLRISTIPEVTMEAQDAKKSKNRKRKYDMQNIGLESCYKVQTDLTTKDSK